MARIRTVKPELWTDPEFTECSLSARLLFIAMLNFASDYGVLPDKPRQLKMQCLPADAIDAEPLIDELVHQRFLERHVAPNGEKVLVIRTFTKNQKINRATKGRWGDPAEWGNPQPPDEADSVSTHGDISESHPSDGKGLFGRDDSDLHLPTCSTGADVDPEMKKIHNATIEATVQDVIRGCIDHRCAKKQNVGNPANYRKTIEHNFTTAERDLIRRHVEEFPDAPVSVHVGAIEDGDTRNLAHYAQPPTEPAEPEQHLSRAEREALIDSNKTDTEET